MCESFQRSDVDVDVEERLEGPEKRVMYELDLPSTAPGYVAVRATMYAASRSAKGKN